MRPALRITLLILVFAALPLGFLELAVSVVGDTRRTAAIEVIRIRQEKALSQINLVDDGAFFASRVVKRLFARIKGLGSEQGSRDLRRLSRTMGNSLELYFFDGTGKVVPALSSTQRGRNFLERCYEVIGEIESGGQPSPGRLGMLRELWKMPRVETLKNYRNGRPMPIGQDPSGGYCFFRWARDERQSRPVGYLAFFRPELAPRDLAAVCAVRAAEKRYPGMQFGLIDLATAPATILPPALERRPEIRSALLKALSGYTMTHADAALVLSAVQRKSHGCFVAVRDLAPGIPPALAWTLRLALVCWAGFLLWRARQGDPLANAGISWRIIGLFLFAVGLPAALLLLGTYRALQDHSLVLQDHLERTMRTKLRQFDERFPLELRRIEDSLRALNVAAGAVTDTSALSRIYEGVRNEPAITEFLVVDPAGKSLWQLREPENAAVAQRYQISRYMAREIVKRINKSDAVDAGTLVSESVSTFAGNLSEAGSWEMFQRNLGQFTPFGVGDEGSFMMFDGLYAGQGNARAVTCAVVFRDKAENLYFSRHRRAFERQPDLTWRVSLWARYRLGRSVYSRESHRRVVDEIGKAVDAQLSPVRKIVETSMGKELWVGQLGQQIKGYVFTAKASLAPIERQVSRLWLLVASAASILILATMALGLFLSEQLLEPISHLGEGIRAIRDRRFDHQVPVRANDELGEVSRLMNQVMEGMQDLSVARIIQENLFPQEETRVAGLAVYGSSRTMTDVGGDYFDYVAIDGQRLFGLVGDVSGHGVSAALIMGMAKCFFTLNLRREVPLEEILLGFNQYMFQTIRRKKMMTLIVFRWDGSTRTLQFANAGHVAPLVRRAATGAVEEISMPCMPLGVKLKAVFQTREIVLDPGDAVFLCTDGFPETKNPQEQQIGYNGPLEWFSEVGDRPPREVIETLFRRLAAFQGEAPMSDDVTMISLRALPGMTEEGARLSTVS